MPKCGEFFKKIKLLEIKKMMNIFSLKQQKQYFQLHWILFVMVLNDLDWVWKAGMLFVEVFFLDLIILLKKAWFIQHEGCLLLENMKAVLLLSTAMIILSFICSSAWLWFSHSGSRSGRETQTSFSPLTFSSSSWGIQSIPSQRRHIILPAPGFPWGSSQWDIGKIPPEEVAQETT